MAYIDDYILIGSKEATQAAFLDLSALLTKLGLPMNSDKRTPPTRALTCLGIHIDIAANTLSIDSDKLRHIYMECIHASKKTTLSRKAMQSLLWKLLYLHKCVLPARTFINRILDLFRRNSQARKIHLDSGFHKDIQWFISFLPNFNGVTYLRKTSIPHFDSLHLDASLTGLGGTWSNRVYATPVLSVPGFNLGIVHLEMFNIVIALRLWAKFWAHSYVRIYCDNMAVVQVVKTSKTRDRFLAACVRNIWFLSATWDIKLDIKHIPGKHNTIADLLSRLSRSCE